MRGYRTWAMALACLLIEIGPGWAQSFDVLQTDLAEGGKRIRLEVVVYKPDKAGPLPLLVFNHGSTGSGRDSQTFRRTHHYSTVAQFFTARGWIVAFPQRRGRGKSDGLYDEGFASDRRSGYACEPRLSLPGADRALADIHAAIQVLVRRADVDGKRVLIGGQSRGGVLSVAYAGRHPASVLGVINFVGGWMGTHCANAATINESLFARGGNFPKPTLWLYGHKDRFYSIYHSRSNFEAFQKAGGKGRFLDFQVPSGEGHDVWKWVPLWQDAVAQYLKELQIDKAGGN